MKQRSSFMLIFALLVTLIAGVFAVAAADAVPVADAPVVIALEDVPPDDVGALVALFVRELHDAGSAKDVMYLILVMVLGVFGLVAAYLLAQSYPRQSANIIELALTGGARIAQGTATTFDDKALEALAKQLGYERREDADGNIYYSRRASDAPVL